ncbi:hypothetical protein SNE40_012523 [Patella caerulea]|uniref:Uncharacterized protein n=1 Tax=Patella caerulea TaxID=87958 RepID=A0AAN8JP08_PATCE
MSRRKKSSLGPRRKYHYRKKGQPSSHNHEEHPYDKSNQNTEIIDRWAEAMKSFYLTFDEETETTPENELMDSDGDRANSFYVILHRVYQYSPNEDLDDFVENILMSSRIDQFHQLTRDLQKFDHFGEFTLVRDIKNDFVLKFVSFYNSSTMSIKACVIIDMSFNVTVQIHRMDLPKDSTFWIGLPHIYKTVHDIARLLQKLEQWNVCMGNYESDLIDILPSDMKSTSAYREYDMGAFEGDIKYSSTIRSVQCELIVSSGLRCQKCSIYRSTLRKTKQRKKMAVDKTLNGSSRKSHAVMSKPELIMKVDSLKGRSEKLKVENHKLKKNILDKMKTKGVKLMFLVNK